ncbi:MAG: YiiX/YebB-like N1pC/P60 family cysteine hydrolase [Verrucomicrobiota bacterium]
MTRSDAVPTLSPTPESVLPEGDSKLRRAATAVLGATAPETLGAPAEIAAILEKSRGRDYFLPDEDDAIRVRYARFLGTREVLLSVLESMESLAGRGDEAWQRQLPAFAVALTASFRLIRSAEAWVALAADSRKLRKKLDEADSRHGIPRKSFAHLYRADTKTSRRLLFRHAVEFFRSHRHDFAPLESDPPFSEILGQLDEESATIDLSAGRIWLERLRYRWFSYRRRHHSAWKKTVFEVFRQSGSVIADLRQPGIKSADAPKRVTPDLRQQALELARPGDVFVTRHDDAMSNLFLPGFWPHAALFIGSEADRAEMGLQFPVSFAGQLTDPICFLESKKDGVRLRPAEDTLAVDAFVILRPSLETAEIGEALGRAIGHAGKLYDFVFDFRCSDRLACTEVIYRTYHHCGPLEFELIETGGRWCLPAEELIAQALEQRFTVVATCGIGSGGLIKGRKAELALHATRTGL